MVVSDQNKFKITLWEINTTSGSTGGWRGAQKAVVFDASNIGIEEYANDSGSAYWTLTNDHPQIAEFVPLARHYEISRWSPQRSRWEFAAAGILSDYSITEYETTFSGIDYKAVLNQYYTPLSQMSVSSASAVTLYTDLNGSTSDVAFVSSEGTSYVSTGDVEISITTQTAGFDQYITNGYWLGGTNNNLEYSGGGHYVSLRYTATYTGATTSGFSPDFSFAVYASPPANSGNGGLPVGKSGLIGVYNAARTGFSCADGADMYTIKTANAIAASTTFCGTSLVTRSLNYQPDYNAQNIYDGSYGPGYPLRDGVTYSFQIYAAILRTSTGVWYRSESPAKTGEFTVGQESSSAGSLIATTFNSAKASSSYARIRSSSLSIIGASVTNHTVFSSGEPVLDHIANICELEMGAKTNGDKVVFGISKPTTSATYSGNFLLKLSVSSAATTAFSLRYPDNIKAFSYNPGYSRVRNIVTVIPTEKYLTGSTGQNSGGTQLVGAESSNTSSQATYGTIPFISAKGGFVNAQAATNEANRLLNTLSVSNTKQVSLSVVVDAVDLWNGWDVGDSVNVTIKKSLVDINEPFVISGVRWFGENDGHERVELELVQGSAFGAQFSTTPGGTSATASRR